MIHVLISAPCSNGDTALAERLATRVSKLVSTPERVVVLFEPGLEETTAASFLKNKPSLRGARFVTAEFSFTETAVGCCEIDSWRASTPRVDVLVVVARVNSIDALLPAYAAHASLSIALSIVAAPCVIFDIDLVAKNIGRL